VGRIPDEDIARVRDATDLVALVSERVVMRQKGRLFWGCCPFHGEKTPSFKIDPATQLFKCFGCGASGDAFGWVMRTENLEFLDAVRVLADREHIELHETGGGVPKGRRDRLIAACEAAAEFYHGVLTRGHDAGANHARQYLAKRGFGSDVAKRFKLGFAPGRGALAAELTKTGFSAEELIDANLAMRGTDGKLRDRFFERVIFPIHDLQGRTIAFGGRVLGDGEPKYLNTSSTPIFDKGRNLYAIDVAKGPMTAKGGAIVVEGYTDVIALHEAGITNSVATLGTALTREHVKTIGRFTNRITYLFDGDEAGMRAADRAVEFVDRTLGLEAGKSQTELFVAVIPGGQDPADFVAAQGAEALSEVVAGGVALLRFAIDRRLARHDLSRPEERARALADATQVLAPVKESILAHDYINYIADRLMVDFETVKRAVRDAKPLQPEMAPEEVSQPVAIPVVETPVLRAERETLARLVSSGRPSAGARFLLAEDVLADGGSIRIAKALSEMPDGDERAILDRLAATVPEAASALAGALVELEGGVSSAEALVGLMTRLKEFELERRITEGKLKLKRPAELKEQAEYDDLFKEVSALTRELDELRRGVRDIGFDPEA
jgi:DNA primase